MRRLLQPLYLICGVLLAAALILGIYSYRSAAELIESSERSVIEANRLLGDQTRQRIDTFIVDSDRQLFNLVDLEHPSDFARRFGDIVRLSPTIEAAVLLDEKLEILPGGYASKRRSQDAEAFRSIFLTKVLPDLPLAALETNLHKHLHKDYDGRDFLLSFIKRQREGRLYYVVLMISIDYLFRELFPTALDPLVGKVLFAVIDDRDRVIYGTPVGRPGRFLYEQAFPTTLYQWKLQLAPLESATLQVESIRRRRFELVLVAMTCAILIVGIGFLLYLSESERRSNQMKSDFISNVSHELKTPLSLIRMFGELLGLGRAKSPERAREYADIITRESERLTRLIDNVLDFARMERGRSAYEFKLGRLDEVVERSLDVYRLRIEREGLELATKLDADLPPTMLDENAMTLVLLNLVENAVKYGRGQITVYLTRVGDRLRLVVADQGPGIPLDEQKRIFDRFYRTRQARETRARGSGIGLSLVKHIAEAHGGSVTVESEPNQGAAFIVDIPIASGVQPA